MRDPLDVKNGGNSTGEWLSGAGPESDIVMSTRIRLARNVSEYPFLTRIEERQKAELERFLRDKLERASLSPQTPDPKLLYKNLNDLSAIDRQCLVERHLISRYHATGDGGRGVALGSS